MERKDIEKIAKTLKRHPIALNETSVKLHYGKEEIHQLIPHRAPFSLVDRITRIDLPNQSIEATSAIAQEDPIFEGHFPEHPVYPGVFQIELMGQAGLCLAAFVIHQTTSVKEASPVKGLFTKVHYAGFQGQIFPGDSLTILVQMLEYDDYLGIVGAQILKNGKIVSYAILEVYFEA